jgi:hypothetical protein
MRATTFIRGKKAGVATPVFFLVTDGGCGWVNYKFASGYDTKAEAEADMKRFAFDWDATVTDIKTETHYR